MADQTPQAIVKWADKQARSADTPAYRRMTDTDRILALKLSSEGLTQVQIAQRLNRAQSTISEWLAKCEDSTQPATQYLRGRALHMARKVANSDDGKVLIQALKGVNVLQEQQQAGVTVVVGAGSRVLIAPLSPINTQQLTDNSTG